MESSSSKMIGMLECLVQSTLDVYMGWDFESPHLEEVPQMLHSLPRLHCCQAERPKGFRSWRTTPLSLGSN